MAHAIKLVQGDVAPLLMVVLNDVITGQPIDVSSVTSVTMKFRARGSTTVIDTLTATKLTGRVRDNGSIDTSGPYAVAGAGGRVSFTWTHACVDSAPGYYDGEVIITYPDTSKTTVYDYLAFYIRA